jgi:hypothetical protein
LAAFFLLNIMKNTIIITIYIVLLFFGLSSKCQVNLVLNPSFEDLNSCPTDNRQISKAQYWDTLVNGGGGTPDLFNECCTNVNNTCGVPINWTNKGYQYPKTGTSYTGIVAASSFSNGTTGREYMQGTLNNTLVSGQIYCVKFYLSLSNASKFSCVTVGAYFDNGLIQTGNHSLPLQPVNPQILNSNTQLDDSLNWVAIEGSFTANGTEQYITIGNFFPDSLSGIQSFQPGGSFLFFEGAYYYIDDVSVIDISTPAFAGNDTTITAGDSIYLGRPSEIGLDEACVWFLDGMPIDTVAGITVAPDSTTTYILEQTICGNVQYDTVTVTIDTGTATSLAQFTKQEIRVFPNPSSGEIFIKANESGNAILHVYSVDRKLLHQQNINDISQENNVSLILENGLYIVTVKTDSQIYTTKLTIIR